MAERFYTKQMPNGLMLLGQQMDQVSSAAMALLLPAGAAHDPSGLQGAASVASEWCMRGAAQRDNRQLNEALDFLGCQHSEYVRSEHLVLTAAQLGRNLADVLAIYADIVRRPRLEEKTFDPCRDLTEQDLASLEDEPAKKCTTLLKERFFPYPLGSCVYGRAETLATMQAAAVREFMAERYSPAGAILAVAGDIDWEAFCGLAEENFGGWIAKVPPALEPAPAQAGVTHIKKDSAQTHIALAHRSVTMASPHYYAARMAETVLSGGMSSRLFTEVREKRGLVYHVSTRYNSLKDYAGMFTYAGTTPDKAQDTFDVTVGELRRLAQGIEEAEMARSRTQLKSSLIMQGESTEARSSMLASDWHHLGRLRSLKELSDAIDAVTVEDVMEYLAACPASDFTVLVIGPDMPDVGRMSE